MATDIISNKDAIDKINRGEDVLIIDARPEEIYTGGSDQIQGAIHLPESMLHEMYTSLPKNREFMIYATKGNEELSKKLADFLRDKGYTAYAIDGGYEDWRDSDLPIEPINAPGTPLL